MIEETGPSYGRPGIHEYYRALRRRWRTGLFVLVACVGAALAYSLVVTPTYVASSDVLIEPSQGDAQTSGSNSIDASEVATQTQVATSLPVARLVQRRLSLSTTPDLSEFIQIQAVGVSRILRITAEDTQPESAVTWADTVAAAYIQFREEDSIGRYERARDRLAQEQSDVERKLDETNALLAERPGSDPALQAERRSLLTSLTQIASQTEGLTDQLTRAGTGGELVRAAELPTSPVSPMTLLNALLGALVGLVAGIGAALLRDRLDDAVHEEETVRTSLGAVILGRIPQWSERNYRDRLVTLQDPHSSASEEYQRLGVNVRFMLATENRESGAVVLVTSGQSGEGKTATSCNLAVAVARLGLRVVLVDADVRRAAAAGRFGLGDPPGLSDLIVGDGETGSYLIDVGVENLMVLPAGTSAPNPAALLSSAGLRRVLTELAGDADMVILDSPPVLTGADTLELSNLSDMVVVVARERTSRRRQLVSVRESLRQASVGTIGVVYNALGESPLGAYPYSRREREVTPHPGPSGSPNDDPAKEPSSVTLND